MEGSENTQLKRTTKRSESISEQDLEKEKVAQVSRQNQQLLIYIFVSVVIVVSWVFGTWNLSFLWVFVLIALTFGVWHEKVIKLTEERIKHKEIQIHRKRALRQSETTEWLNFILNRWWMFSSNALQDLMKRSLDPKLNQVKPAFLENIELFTFSVGENTPYIKYIQVFECTDGKAGGKKPMSWFSVSQSPQGLRQCQQYQMVLEMDMGLTSDEFKMVFRARLGGKWMGMNLDVAVEKLNISGRMQLVVTMDMNTPFPHVASVSFCFLEKPEVWFSIRVMKALQMMEIPILKSWIHSLVMDGLTQALVDPGKFDLKMESSGPAYAPAENGSKTSAQGVITVTISCDPTKSNVNPESYYEMGKSLMTKTNHHFAALQFFADDVRYCVLTLNEQKQHTLQTQGNSCWQDTASFLVDSLQNDKLVIKSKSKRLLSTYTLAQFDLHLADYPLEHKPFVETSVEEKVSKWQTGGTVKLDLMLEYSPLPDPEAIIRGEGDDQPLQASQEVAGVMYVCVHSGNNLMALDRNGTSDPYCVIFSNGKKQKTTHFVCRTRHPSWEVSTEFLVGDYTKTMISFIVYDWDGHNTSDDDFLGSAYVVLTEDDPQVVKKPLTLGYNVPNVGQVDNMQMGTITVSVLFRPVPSVAKSNLTSTEKYMSEQEYEASRKNFMSSAKNKAVSSKDKKSDSMGVGNLLAKGHGILELNILKAKDLVPMDSNGFSDPFCEVRIGSERKFTTSIKKKTLNPVWDEWVTMQMPKVNEILEIIVWDRDPFFRKDFLGCVSFSRQDLKQQSKSPTNDGWFTLTRIKSGQIQLHFKVISDDTATPDFEEHDAGCSPSESTDSGLPTGSPSFALEPPHQATTATPVANERQDFTCAPNERGIDVNGNGEVLKVPSGGKGEKTGSVPPSGDGGKTKKDRKKMTFRLKKSASDANLKKKPREDAIERGDVLDSNLDRHDSSSSLSDSLYDFGITPSASNLEDHLKYFGVEGVVLKIRGMPNRSQMVYCKVRLDNRTVDQRTHRLSHGKVMAKSHLIQAEDGNIFNLPFRIDQGHGVAKEALLIFDLKDSHKEHIATKGYTLQYLLEDLNETKKWIRLEHNVELEITLKQGGEIVTTKGKKREKSGFFGRFRKSKKD